MRGWNTIRKSVQEEMIGVMEREMIGVIGREMIGVMEREMIGVMEREMIGVMERERMRVMERERMRVMEREIIGVMEREMIGVREVRDDSSDGVREDERNERGRMTVMEGVDKSNGSMMKHVVAQSSHRHTSSSFWGCGHCTASSGVAPLTHTSNTPTNKRMQTS